MEKISEAVVSKVKLDAQSLIKEAEKKAQEELEKAKKQREVRLEEERGRMLGERPRRRLREFWLRPLSKHVRSYRVRKLTQLPK